MVFCESPHRIADTLADLEYSFGTSRRIVIARELTKLFEQIHVCALGEAGIWLGADANRVKGEFVLLVEGATERGDDAAEAERVLTILLEALPVNQAAKIAARITGQKKNALYARALELKQKM